MLANPTVYSPSACSSGISFASGPPTPAPPSSSQQLYRYEELGLLIYDSHARFPEEKCECTSPPFRCISQSDRRELESALDPDRSQYLSALLYPPSRVRSTDYTLYVPEDCLRFNSHFESGNLRKVVKVSEFEYHLTLEADVGSLGHMQWYYFTVSNMREGQTVKFCITNLTKAESLYQVGMQPLVHSRIKEQRTHLKWHRGGTEVTYQPNLSHRSDKASFYRTLSFLYRFDHTNDVVSFAHCYPYSLTDLKRDLAVLEATAPSNVVRVETLCETTAENVCPLVTITNKVGEVPLWDPDKKLLQRRVRIPSKDSKPAKKTIVLTARVHPGESNSSYMLKGALDFLTGSSKEAQVLRNAFVFRIVPMLNPDGVVYGNTRCDLIGLDLNRRWISPHRLIHPTIFYAKKLVKTADQEPVLYCDFHGHSRKKNVFIYGCCDPDMKKNAMIKLIPLALQQANRLFSFPDCHFRIEKEKEATGRVVSFREAGVLYSYTLEASFFGPTAAGEELYMTQSHYGSIGRDLCKTMLMLVSQKRFRRKVMEIGAEVRLKAMGEEDKSNVDAETDSEVRNISLGAVLAEIADNDVPSSVTSTAQEPESSSSEEEAKAPVRNPSTASPSRFKPHVRPETAKFRAKSVFQRPKTSNRKRTMDESGGEGPSGLSAEVLEQQVSRIYTMLKYYQEAGGRLATRDGSMRHSHDAAYLRRPYIPQIRVRATPRTFNTRPQSITRSPLVPKAAKDSPLSLLLDRSRRSTQSRSWSRS